MAVDEEPWCSQLLMLYMEPTCSRWQRSGTKHRFAPGDLLIGGDACKVLHGPIPVDDALWKMIRSTVPYGLYLNMETLRRYSVRSPSTDYYRCIIATCWENPVMQLLRALGHLLP